MGSFQGIVSNFGKIWTFLKKKYGTNIDQNFRICPYITCHEIMDNCQYSGNPDSKNQSLLGLVGGFMDCPIWFFMLLNYLNEQSNIA